MDTLLKKLFKISTGRKDVGEGEADIHSLKKDNVGVSSAAIETSKLPKLKSRDCDARTKRNARSSQFLRLPREIRDQILRLVIGDQLIHIKFTDILNRLKGNRHARFRHCVCTSDQSEDAAYQEFRNGYQKKPLDDSLDYYSRRFKDRHIFCKPFDNVHNSLSLMDGRLHGLYTLASGLPISRLRNLSILLVCRQLYEEASCTLWTTNTFSFDDPLSLERFIDVLSPSRSRYLAALHIDLLWYSSCFNEWNALLSPEFVESVPGVRKLHITFNQDSQYVIPGHRAPMLGQLDAKKPLLNLQLLPLRHVTVIIGDDTRCGRSRYNYVARVPERMTLREKRRVAEEVRSMLLNPRDPHPVST